MAAAPPERARSVFGSSMSPGMEKAYWYFLRVSGVALVFLAGGHLLITHYLNVPSETTFDFVSARWANPGWRSFDTLLLVAALWHGLIGMRFSIADYVRSAGGRQIGYAAIWVFGVVFTVLGLITIVTFDEEMSRTNSGPLSGEIWIGDVLGYSLFVFAVVTYVAMLALAIWIVSNLRHGRPPIYAGDIGQYAWVMHRATGIGILFFLLIHIIDIMLIGLGRDVYDHTVEFYANPFIIPMEILLVGALIYHLLNGLRIVVVNFSASGPSHEKKYFWWVMGLTVLLTIPSAVIIFAKEVF
ncbi:MAG: succinate dehydrogenase, cytochrome b556 subunit [Chloroflexia bacterium]|nr:succinate dehydrogenase, cytochrome b556 subunit [Chloroflexia bacterium]